MATLEISALERAVADFNKQALSFSNTDHSTIRIDTPFYDRHNDTLIIYVTNLGNNTFKLTDAGYILDDLEGDGIFITRSNKRIKTLERQLNSYSVKFDTESNELYIETDLNDYPVKQNLLIQAMLFVNDMFLVSKKHVSDIFITDVANFLESKDIRATDGSNIIGETGMIHHYEFAIAGIRDIPDKLLRVMNTPQNEYYAKAVAMDIRQTRPVLNRTTEFYTVINDTDKPIDSKIIKLFDSENITSIPFSEREKFANKLAE